MNPQTSAGSSVQAWLERDARRRSFGGLGVVNRFVQRCRPISKQEGAMIYYFGLPGAGKTTLAKRVALSNGVAHKYDVIARPEMCSELSYRFRFLLRSGSQLRKQLRIFDAWSYHKIASDPELEMRIALLYELFFCNVNFDRDSRRGLMGQLKAIERDYVFGVVARKYDQVYYDDDGLLQRLVSLFGFRGCVDSSWVFSNYIIDCLPVAAKIVYVKCPVDICISRMQTRSAGVPLPLRNRDDFSQGLFDAQTYTHGLFDWLSGRGFSVCSVDTVDLSLDEAVDEVRGFVS